MTCTCTITSDGHLLWQIKKCRLCEAAPALYEALNELKAYGGCLCDYHSSQHTDFPDTEHSELCIKACAAIQKAEAQ